MKKFVLPYWENAASLKEEVKNAVKVKKIFV